MLQDGVFYSHTRNRDGAATSAQAAMDERTLRAAAREPYENNYGGALRRLNAIRERLAALDWADTPTFEINGLKREELIASGSVILHEIYFDSLGGHGDDPPGGSGWAILAWSGRLGRLVNHWAADHAHGLAGATPILALDMYEHAYHLDFGPKAAAYVDRAMANLNWHRCAVSPRNR